MSVDVAVGGTGVDVGGTGVDVGGTGVAVGGTGATAGAPHPTKNNMTNVTPIICCSDFWQFMLHTFFSATSR